MSRLLSDRTTTLIAIVIVASGLSVTAHPQEVAGAPTTLFVPDDFATIQSAVDNANPGDTIVVRSGTYYENVDIVQGALTIRSENGASDTIVEAADSNDHVFHLLGNEAVLKGFHLKGAIQAAAIRVESSDNTIEDNVLEANQYGLYLVGGCGAACRNSVKGNTFRLNTDYAIHLGAAWCGSAGVSIACEDNTIWRNRLHNSGVRLVDGNQFCTDVGNYYAASVPSSQIPWAEDPGPTPEADTTVDQVTGSDFEWGMFGTYESIQEAIYNTNAHRTAAVVPGSGPYSETVVIRRDNVTLDFNGESLQGDDADDGVYVEATGVGIGNGTIVGCASGIHLHRGSACQFLNNHLSANVYGIRLGSSDYGSSDNLVQGNHVVANQYGIHLYAADDNFLAENLFETNECGLYLSGGCAAADRNEVAGNTFRSNTDYAIYLGAGWCGSAGVNIACEANNIWRNNFESADPSSKIRDVPNNKWLSPERVPYRFAGHACSNYLGNYWSDYMGADGDGDGVGDSPYLIDLCYDDYPLTSTPDKYQMMVRGIDVSHYQGGIDWDAVHADGYEFAFVKATEGDDRPPQCVDEYLHNNMHDAMAAGMLVGAYHLAYPQWCVAEDEARFFVSVAGDYIDEGYLRPALDLEYGNDLSTTALSAWVQEFIETVRGSTGVTPLIYATKSFAQHELDASIAEYDLWLADWTCSTNDPPTEGDTGIWEGDWAFWQYWEPKPDNCGIQPVPGIAGGVDLDLFAGDMSDLAKFVIGQGDHEPPRVEALSVQPDTAPIGEDFTISFTASDYQSGLCWVELWRRHEEGEWEQVGGALDLTAAGSGPYSASFLDDTCIETGLYEYGIHVGDTEGNWTTERGCGLMPVQVEVTANAVPECVIELRKAGTTSPASIVDVGEPFDIFVGDSSDDIGIEAVRFASDCYQDDELTHEWTQWYDWEASSGDWNATQKTRGWSFQDGGVKEVWVQVRDGAGQTDTDHAFIKTPYAPNPYGYRFKNSTPWGVSDNDKCAVFDEVFGSTSLSSAYKTKVFDAYCSGGHCWGMASSSLQEFGGEENDPLLKHMGKPNVYSLNADGRDPVVISHSGRTYWDGSGGLDFSPVLLHVIKHQLAQRGKLEPEWKYHGVLLNDLLYKDYATELSILCLYYQDVVGHDHAHAVVPYEVEGDRIHVYDPNRPNVDNCWLEISPDYQWGWKYGDNWPPDFFPCFPRDAYLWLCPLEDVARKPDCDFSTTSSWFFRGDASLVMTDGEGRRSGFQDGQVFAEIPGVNIQPLLGALPDGAAASAPQVVNTDEVAELLATVHGDGDATYSLKRFGPGYFGQVSGSFGYDGDSHDVTICADEVEISFADTQSTSDSPGEGEQQGTYGVVMHNASDTHGGTISVEQHPCQGATHNYVVDWEALAADMPAVTVSKDSDGDGTFEDTAITTPPLAPSNPSPPDGAFDIDGQPSLTWTGGDPDAGDTVTYSVRIAADPDPSIVAEGLYACEYSSENLMPCQTYYWQVIARDNHGVTTGGPMWSFTTDYETRLRAGWNMVSVPIAPADASTSAVFPDVEAVYTWDSSTKSYVVPDVIVPHQGYWVAVLEDMAIELNGTPVTTWTSVQDTGWNMIGSVHGGNVFFSSPDDDPANAVEGFAYWWNPDTKSYEYCTSIEPCNGYWIASTQDCSLTMGPPT